MGTRSPHMKRRSLATIIATLILAMLAVPAAEVGFASASQRIRPADSVFINGKVLRYTAHGKTWAQSVAVRDGKIVYVGGNTGSDRFVGYDTDVIDLHGKMLMPGLGDGHQHGQGFVQCNMGYEGGTVDDVLSKLKACLLREDQLPYLQSNYVMTAFYFVGEAMQPPGTLLDRTMLDRLSTDPADDPFGTGTTRPIRLINADFHKSYANSQAIVNAGVTGATDPQGGFIGLDANGDPNGQFSDFSADWGPELPEPADANYLAKQANLAEMNSKGVTSILQPLGFGEDLAVWKQLADDGLLTARVDQALLVQELRGETDPGAVDAALAGIDQLRDQYGGYTSPASPGSLTTDTVKIFCDGVAEFPAQTAAMLRPYNENIGTPEDPVWVPTDNRGEDPSCEDATLGFVKLDEAHWSIHIHGIGNRASRVALDNFEAAIDENPAWDRRHTITHLQFVTGRDIERFGELGIVASMSLQWARRDVYSIDAIEGYVDPRVAGNMYPARDLLGAGAVLAAGSDWPVDPLLPWVQMETAVDRTGEVGPTTYPGALVPSNAISLLQSVKASTLGVAYQMHQDDVVGSIAVGKYADLIVLDQNLFQIPIESISDTTVLMTMVGGQVVYEDPDQPI